MKMTLVIPTKNVTHFKTALKESGGWHVRNPDILTDGLMVFVEFPENCIGYHQFWEVYECLTTPIVEIDNRTWCNKILNHIKNWFR
jgi:hypothetical protein